MNHANAQAPKEAQVWLQRLLQAYHELVQTGQTFDSCEITQALAVRMQTQEPLLAAWFEGAAHLSLLASDQNIDGDAIFEEKQSLQIAMNASRPLLEARLQMKLDQLDQPRQSVLCPQCQKTMSSEGRRTRPWQSTLGPLNLKRRYLRCKPCHQGKAPAQARVGLPEGSYTGRLEELCSLMTTTLPIEGVFSIKKTRRIPR